MIHFSRTTTVLLLLAMLGTTHVSAGNMEHTAMNEENSNDATTEKEEISLNISFSQNTLRYNTEDYKSFAEPEVYFSISDSKYEIEDDDKQKIKPTKTTDNANVVTIAEDGTVKLTGNIGKAQIIYTYQQGTCWKVGDASLTEYTYIETMAAYTVVVTNATPTEISTAAQWKEFANNNNERGNMCQYIKLTNDITLDDDCPMVGNASYPFSGIVDGNGHTLTVNINNGEKENVAPFPDTDGAYIKNLRIAGIIKGTKNVAGFIGLTESALAYDRTEQLYYDYFSETVIENCVSSATISGNSETAGFIAIAQNAFSIKNCLFDGEVESASDEVGRFICRNSESKLCNSSISNSLSVGHINVKEKHNYDLANTYNNVYVATDKDNLNIVEGETITLAELADGSFGWKNLNDNGTTNIWKQNISYEKYPSPFSKHEIKQGTYMYPNISVGANSMTTMAIPVAIDELNNKNVKIYTVESAEDDVLQLKEYTEKSIPAGMPVILYNPTDEQASFYARLRQASFYYNKEQTDNLLQTQYLDLTQSGLQTFYAPAGSYVMQKKQDDTLPAFYQVEKDNQIKVKQFRCYLKPGTATAALAPRISMEIDGNGEPTGIGSVTTEDSTLEGDGKIYDLSGRRVSTMQKGQIYIVGGHKFMIK